MIIVHIVSGEPLISGSSAENQLHLFGVFGGLEAKGSWRFRQSGAASTDESAACHHFLLKKIIAIWNPEVLLSLINWWFIRFMAKHLDAELKSLMETTVPPIELDKVSNFRSCLFKFKRKADLSWLQFSEVCPWKKECFGHFCSSRLMNSRRRVQPSYLILAHRSS